jgi:AcrR family transcriptional regulator
MEADGAAPAATPSRAERKRQQRMRTYVDAAKKIVADEGFEGLTMARLAAELDTAISAVYRYFPSKGALMAQIQLEAIEQLSASLSVITQRGDERFAELGLGDQDAAAARLVLFGRWMCAASEAYPEDIRLLQMIMSQRASMLDAHGGERIFPVAMSLVGKAVAAVEAAQEAGAITPAGSLDRALIWAATLGGVLQTDDLEAYAPELFGRARLARQANLDLLAGWGVPPEDLARASRLVDDLAADGPLAP